MGHNCQRIWVWDSLKIVCTLSTLYTQIQWLIIIFPIEKFFLFFWRAFFFWQIWARRGARHENRFWTGDFGRFFGPHRIIGVPSGYVNSLRSGKWPILFVVLAIKDGDFPSLCLPECTPILNNFDPYPFDNENAGKAMS